MARISFIDDDLASELVAENLRYRGHDVERFSSADDALQNADALARSDLVVLDLVMPGSASTATSVDGPRSTGMSVFRALRQRRRDLPILIFTANQDPNLVQVIRDDRHARYISRWAAPRFDEFVGVLHEMLGVENRPALPRPLIVHGHDDVTKMELKNYLQNTLGLPEPVILHEQPNVGRTLIEKFEDLATSVDIAFVLLTPDDELAKATDTEIQKRRARQNVILELGFFLGLFGRRSGRIFLLHKGPLEIPSDLAGIVYIDIANGVQSRSDEIRRELKAVWPQQPVGGGRP